MKKAALVLIVGMLVGYSCIAYNEIKIGTKIIQKRNAEMAEVLNNL